MDFQLGDLVWIISFDQAEDFYLLSQQTITDFLDGKVECEDDFNTFHVSYEDIYRDKKEAIKSMIQRLNNLADNCE